MNSLSKQQALNKKDNLLEEIKSGKIFIYPTDTIYGIGCNALLKNSVRQIRKLKQRDTKPFSVIAPSKKWILENCAVDKKAEKWVRKLPGPYTLILKLKNKNSVAEETNTNAETLGVRIPDNWFAKLIKEASVPFVTTSVNLSGESPISKLTDLPENLKNDVDYIIYEGERKGRPSKIIYLVDGKEKIIVR